MIIIIFLFALCHVAGGRVQKNTPVSDAIAGITPSVTMMMMMMMMVVPHGGDDDGDDDADDDGR